VHARKAGCVWLQQVPCVLCSIMLCAVNPTHVLAVWRAHVCNAQKARIQVWLYEQANMRMEGRIIVRSASTCRCAPQMGAHVVGARAFYFIFCCLGPLTSYHCCCVVVVGVVCVLRWRVCAHV